MLMGYGRLDANSFFFSIQVEMYLVARTWLKGDAGAVSALTASYPPVTLMLGMAFGVRH